MLLAKLLLLLSSIAPGVGYFEHANENSMCVFLTDSQMKIFIEEQKKDEAIKRSVNTYAQISLEEKENLYKVTVNFNRHNPVVTFAENKEIKEPIPESQSDDPEFTTEEYVD